MPQIVTITFSPCIDKSTTAPEVIAEKKLRCSLPVMEPGGGGINVARAIQKLGGNATAVYPAGGYTGKFLKHLLELAHVPSIVIETDHETRESLTVLDLSTNDQYRFGLGDNVLKEEQWSGLLKAVEDFKDVEFIVTSGSLPPGVPLDVYARLAKIALNKNAKLIVDTSGEALNHAVREGPFLIKPNLTELGSLVGRDKIEIVDVEFIAKDIIQRNHCEIIVVSFGKTGAMLITSNETYKVEAPDVTTKSTVGAGDSMLAGIVYSISKKMNLKQALQYGVACGTAATLNPGTELCHKKDADELYSKIKNTLIT